jgi:hypothetical protein
MLYIINNHSPLEGPTLELGSGILPPPHTHTNTPHPITIYKGGTANNGEKIFTYMQQTYDFDFSSPIYRSEVQAQDVYWKAYQYKDDWRRQT